MFRELLATTIKLVQKNIMLLFITIYELKLLKQTAHGDSELVKR